MSNAFVRAAVNQLREARRNEHALPAFTVSAASAGRPHKLIQLCCSCFSANAAFAFLPLESSYLPLMILCFQLRCDTRCGRCAAHR